MGSLTQLDHIEKDLRRGAGLITPRSLEKSRQKESNCAGGEPLSRWRATVIVSPLCMLAARADPDQKSLIISKVLVRLEAMARTKQTARVQPITRATGEKKADETKARASKKKKE